MKSSIVIFLTFGFATMVPQKDRLIDLSAHCRDDVKLGYFLTYGAGFTDAVTCLFAGYNKNCTLNLFTQRNHSVVQMIVVEVLNGGEYTANRCGKNYVTISDGYNPIDVCKSWSGESTSRLFASFYRRHKLSVEIRGNSPETLKLTATAARILSGGSCDPSDETSCHMKETSLCVDVDLKCDDNVNCGVPDGQDEDVAECKPGSLKRTWNFIIPSIFLTAFATLYLTRLCVRFAPKLPRHFFQTSKFEDNKLILGKQSPQGSVGKRLSLKAVGIDSPRVRNKKRPDQKKKIASIACGDQEEDIEEELASHLYEQNASYRASAGRGRKRLTTNSPVNGRNVTILLENLKEFAEETHASTSSYSAEGIGVVRPWTLFNYK